MLRIVISVASVASLCLIIIMLNITTPVSAGPFGVIAIFILMYLLCLGVFANVIYIFNRLYSHLSIAFVANRAPGAISFKKSYYFSTVLSAVPVMLVGIQSVGHLGVYEYVLVFIFAAVGYIYVLKGIK